LGNRIAGFVAAQDRWATVDRVVCVTPQRGLEVALGAAVLRVGALDLLRVLALLDEPLLPRDTVLLAVEIVWLVRRARARGKRRDDADQCLAIHAPPYCTRSASATPQDRDRG